MSIDLSVRKRSSEVRVQGTGSGSKPKPHSPPTFMLLTASEKALMAYDAAHTTQQSHYA
jgi:hypothetical protein